MAQIALALHSAQPAFAVQAVETRIGHKDIVGDGKTPVKCLEHSRQHHIIRVHEADEAASGGFHTSLPGFADSHIGAVKQLYPFVLTGIFPAYFGTAVGTTVVNQYHFQSHPGLRKQTVQTFAQPAFGIENRDDNGNQSFIHSRQQSVSPAQQAFYLLQVLPVGYFHIGYVAANHVHRLFGEVAEDHAAVVGGAEGGVGEGLGVGAGDDAAAEDLRRLAVSQHRPVRDAAYTVVGVHLDYGVGGVEADVHGVVAVHRLQTVVDDAAAHQRTHSVVEEEHVVIAVCLYRGEGGVIALLSAGEYLLNLAEAGRVHYAAHPVHIVTAGYYGYGVYALVCFEGLDRVLEYGLSLNLQELLRHVCTESGAAASGKYDRYVSAHCLRFFLIFPFCRLAELSGTASPMDGPKNAWHQRLSTRESIVLQIY